MAYLQQTSPTAISLNKAHNVKHHPDSSQSSINTTSTVAEHSRTRILKNEARTYKEVQRSSST
jgi:hypothetical protein